MQIGGFKVKKFYCHFELHTKTRTAHVNCLVLAKDVDHAFEMMDDKVELYKEEGLTLQAKSVIAYKDFSEVENYFSMNEAL